MKNMSLIFALIDKPEVLDIEEIRSKRNIIDDYHMFSLNSPIDDVLAHLEIWVDRGEKPSVSLDALQYLVNYVPSYLRQVILKGVLNGFLKLVLVPIFQKNK